MSEKVVIGNAELWHGDCREVLPLLPKHDLLLTDPPYGIGADKGKKGSIPFKGGKPVEMAWNPENTWDDERPAPDVVLAGVSMCRVSIVWGGNYFADFLPPMGRWLWWDKCQTMPSYGDGELAWTSFPATTPKKFTLANNTIFAQRRERFHPTQKPIELIAWCIGFAPQAQTVLDPFMGSGTTGVACAQLGKAFTGIERERKYFDIACERIARAQAQGQMFAPESAALPTQQAMEL